jgi:hypothetical protein
MRLVRRGNPHSLSALTSLAALRTFLGMAARISLVLILVLATGCAALPDVSPFATASRQLAGAVKASGTAISEDLHATPDLEAKAKAFDNAWAVRNDLMRAVVAYSDSLVGIVKASGDSREAARSLAEKVGGLAQAVGVIQPGAGPAVDVAADTAAFVWAQIALARAAASLEEALKAAQPAIDRLTVIKSDSQDLVSIVRGLAEAQRTVLDATYNEAIGYRKDVAARRKTLRAKFSTGLTDAEAVELKRIDDFMAPPNAEVQKYDELKAKIDTREKANRQLIAATRDAIEQWASAHREVAIALQNRRPVSTESLTEAAIELRDLVKRTREL